MLRLPTLGLMLCSRSPEILKSLFLASVFYKQSPVGPWGMEQGLGALVFPLNYYTTLEI